MRRIMFVDDEPHLLSGLRRMLRPKRDAWEMVFALGAAEALEVMAGEPADVVVSDMKMPRMDGAQLLAQIRREYPRTARMILSGHADRMSIISAVGPTQQFLAKPCEVETLIDAIERVLALRDLVVDDRLRELFGGVESLPKPPEIYEEMLAIASDPMSSLDDVVGVIERDLATSAEVLHLVNSPFFGLATRIDSVARAVTLLGLETIQALAVTGAVFRSGGNQPPGLDAAALCRDALMVGSYTRRFATVDAWSQTAVNDAFFSGLLCEVALPVLASSSPAGWQRLRDAGPTDLWAQEEAEVAAFGVSATRATAYLLGLWGFPEAVVTAIAEQPVRPGDRNASPAAAVLTLARRKARHPDQPIPPDPDGYLTAERLSRWEAACADLAGAVAG